MCVLCLQHIVCVFNICSLFLTISCCKDGLNLSLVLKSCSVLGFCQILTIAIAMEGFPRMTPGCELLMPNRRNWNVGNTAGQELSCYTHFLFPNVQSKNEKETPPWQNPIFRQSDLLPTPPCAYSLPSASPPVFPFPCSRTWCLNLTSLEFMGNILLTFKKLGEI